jgi:hypothetical protein
MGFEESFVFKGIAKMVAKTKHINKIVFQGALLKSVEVDGMKILDGRIRIGYDLDIATYRIKNIMGDISISTPAGEYKMTIDGYQIIEKKIIEIKEEKPKSKPVGWMAFFNKD